MLGNSQIIFIQEFSSPTLETQCWKRIIIIQLWSKMSGNISFSKKPLSWLSTVCELQNQLHFTEDLAYEIFCPRLHKTQFVSLGRVKVGLLDSASFEPPVHRFFKPSLEHENSSSSFWSVSVLNHSPQNSCFWHFSQSPAAFAGAYMLLSCTLVWAAKMFQFITYCSVLSLRNMLVLAEWILIRYLETVIKMGQREDIFQIW